MKKLLMILLALCLALPAVCLAEAGETGTAYQYQFSGDICKAMGFTADDMGSGAGRAWFSVIILVDYDVAREEAPDSNMMFTPNVWSQPSWAGRNGENALVMLYSADTNQICVIMYNTASAQAFTLFWDVKSSDEAEMLFEAICPDGYEKNTEEDLVNVYNTIQESAGAAGEAASAGETETEGGEEGELTLHNVRYYFEHVLGRSYFFDDPSGWMDILRNPGPYDFWKWVTEQLSFDTTYIEEDFNVRELEKDGIRMIIVEMPEPEENLDCARIWHCLEPETGNAWYYTVEYNNYFGEAFFLCEWKADGNHMDYGVFEAADPAEEDYEAQLEAEADLILQHIRADSTGFVPDIGTEDGTD